MIEKIKKYKEQESRILLIITGLVIIAFILSFILFTDSQKNIREAKVVEEQTEEIIRPTASFSEEKLESEYGSIQTFSYSIIDSETQKLIRLNDSYLPLDTITNQIETFAKEHKNKIISVGILDNKLYIQIDKTIEQLDEVHASVVSIGETFTSSDWFKMTESVYENSNVLAECVFSHKTDAGMKHFLYIYTEKSEA